MCKLHNSVHLAGMPIEMNWNDALCFGGNNWLDLVHVHVKIITHIDENWGCPTLDDGAYRSNKGMGYGYDLITWAKTKGMGREIECISSSVNSHSMLGSHEPSHVFLKSLHVASQDKITTGHNLFKCPIELAF